MSESNTEMEELVQSAAGIVSVSKGKVGVRKAMELVGFSAEDRETMRLYMKVRRLVPKLKVSIEQIDKKVTPPPAQVGANPASEASSLTTEFHSEIQNDTNTSPGNETAQLNARRRILASPTDDEENHTSPKEKRFRRKSKDIQADNGKIAAAKERNSKAMKAATTLMQRNNALPKAERRNAQEICEETNRAYNSSINPKTAARYVRQGLIGTSPLKPGPCGDVPKRSYTALKGAFSTFLKLEQAECKTQSTVTKLSKLVNGCVNKGGYKKTRNDLARKLQRDTAHMFDVGKANVVEQRRLQWTTGYNLNIWFGTWKDVLIDLGFARAAVPEDMVEGELFFFPGQKQRVGNIDETDGSLDETTGQRGGRPPMTFFAPDVSGGATAANKSGYSSTIICGSNAAGEPFPPHFQLKTLAQTTEGQRMSVDWFQGAKNIRAKFGFAEVQSLPCTFGMNEKAGMNSVELDKYITKAIL